jgi:peptidoglycan/LPS O-acetylase OafA/YrhL
VGRESLRNRSGYRPDIDGLRALAVAAVVTYHGWPWLLPAGFLGVDVFFVISGFVIAAGLLRELDQTALIDFRAFFWRRFRRLAPAFVVVMGFASVAAVFQLGPANADSFFRSQISAFLGISNFWFATRDAYEAQALSAQPLLHTWSLGVEEQFYLVAPFLLFFAWTMAKSPSRLPYVVLQGVLFLGAVAIISWWFLPDQWRYFFPLMRFWELGIGVLLAATMRYREIVASSRVWPFLSTIAAAALIASFYYLGFLASGPSWATSLPLAAVAALIFLGQKTLVSRFFRTAPMVFLGRLSYPIYLWHLPLFEFLEPELKGILPHGGLVTVAVTLLLAVATYFWLEKPIQTSRKPARVWATPLGAAGAILLLFAGAAVTLGTNLLRPGFPQVGEQRVDYGFAPTSQPVEGPHLILVGDSHAAVLGSLREVAQERDFGFASSTESGCQFLLGLERASKLTGEVGFCDSTFQLERYSWLANFDPSIVVLAGRLPLFIEGDRFDNTLGGDEGDLSDYLREPGTRSYAPQESRAQITEAYVQTVEAIRSLGHQVVLIYPVPEVGWNVPNRLYENNFAWPPKSPVLTLSRVWFERAHDSHVLLDSISGPGIYRVKTSDLFCDTTTYGYCVTSNEEAIFYSDDDHLSSAGAQLVADKVADVLGRLCMEDDNFMSSACVGRPR